MFYPLYSLKINTSLFFLFFFWHLLAISHFWSTKVNTTDLPSSGKLKWCLLSYLFWLFFFDLLLGYPNILLYLKIKKFWLRNIYFNIIFSFQSWLAPSMDYLSLLRHFPSKHQNIIYGVYILHLSRFLEIYPLFE